MIRRSKIASVSYLRIAL